MELYGLCYRVFFSIRQHFHEIATFSIWAIIKALEQIKDFVASKYIIFQTHFCVSRLYNISNWNISWSIVNISANVFFPLGKMIGMVWLRTSFILPSRSWEIGSSLTSSARRMELSCVVHTSVVHIWHIHTSWRKILHLSVSTVSTFWQLVTFWWSVVKLLKQGQLYLEEEMSWNHLDSNPHLYYCL